MDRKHRAPGRDADDRRSGESTDVMRFAYRAMLEPRLVRFAVITAVFLVGVFTLVGPIGSYENLSLMQRSAYAIVCAVIGWPLSHSMATVTLYLMRRRTARAAALAGTLVMLVAAAPCSAVATTYHVLFLGDDTFYDGFLTLYLLVASLTVSCFLLVFYVARHLVRQAPAAGVSGVRERDSEEAVAGGAVGDGAARSERADADPATATGHAAVATAATDPQARFFDRLPPELGRELIYLKTADHYVEVHTTAGSARVLVRLVDAVAELGSLGIRVHRSYWVAHRQMTDLVEHGNRLLLRLAGGHEVPVSSTYLPAVRAALRVDHEAGA